MKTRYLTLLMFIGITTLMLYSCSFFRGTGSTSNDTSICSNYSRVDESELDVDLVHEMTKIYQNTPNDGVEAIWFDLETLKKFVYHIERNAKINDQSVASQNLGVRIYYSRYPKKPTWNSIYNRDLSGFSNNTFTNQYEWKHTLVMIPTIKRGQINYDFNPLDSTTYLTGLTSDYDPSNNDSNSNQGQRTSALTPTASAQNHGQLHPPYSDTGMFFIN
ncbi:hypothetical protein [uncultured Lacinutrix sp.]|uniref:hypothetical protein n=1 Tax=uncultured Lacinutrix sp. TaxID=574032 RepID=UPI00262E473C|nr:hypothetical protein [uncultured Lacinutrix sp.]